MNLLGRGVAVAVPALLLAACGDATSSRSAGDDPTTSPSPSAATSSPAETASETATPTATTTQDGPGDLTTKGLATGAPPAVPYLRADGDSSGGWSLVEPGAEPRRLPHAYDAFAPMGDGLVATRYDTPEPTVVILDADLRESSQVPMSDGTLAVTPDGAIVGWLGADDRPHVVEDGGRQEWDLPAVEGGGHLAALISDGTTCKEGEGGNGCAAFVNSTDGTRAWSAISHGIVDTVPGVIAVGDVTTDGHLVAMTSVSDEGSCWGRFQVWKRKPVWQTCDYTLFDFSPSGGRILAGPAYLDGFGQGSATVLDDDGNVVASWRTHGADSAAVLHTVWEDDDHVLAIVWQDDTWAVLRLGLDGSVELAVAPVPDDGEQNPFVLPTR